jgi:two-component system chemotaxis sensor kinase CheA
MPDEFDEIIGDFITESEESLDTIDPLFVELEAKGDDKEIINQIFRSMHTIKGAAGFLGFQQIVDVAHLSESILKKLREGEFAISTNLMNAVLKSVDMIRALLQHIKHKDGVAEDITPVLSELETALSNAQGIPVSETRSASEFISSESPQQGSPEASSTIQEIQTEDSEQSHESISASQAQVAEKTTSTVPVKESIQTLRVDIDKIDKVMNLTGEVVLIRNRLLNIMNYLGQTYSNDSNIDALYETVSFLDLVTSDMQLSVMKMRMQPIKKVFGKFPRVVRDIATSLNKDVDLVITGEDTEVDKTVIEQIGDPLIHIIRNAVDHGIESKEERLLKNKPPKGTILIEAYQKGNQIVITVLDDGKGIDVARVKKKALDRGLITEDEFSKMSDESAINLIFLPGFSTQDTATELSGRGVGMDVVKTNISRLNGYVEITTKKDVGSSFIISIPLTLAIIETLMVRAAGDRYAIPLMPVEEITKISSSDMYDVVGQKVVKIRERVYPIYSLSYILGEAGGEGVECKYAVIVSIGSGKFCLAVEELLGQEEVVIKTIEGLDAVSSYILGATITGDGKVVLILDLASISRNALGHKKGKN